MTHRSDRDGLADVPAPDRALVSEVERAVRQRLARELHDAVAQTLTLMVVEMETFKLDQAGQPDVAERVDSLQEGVREVLHNLRQVVSDLREEPASDEGFTGRVGELLARFEASTGIRSALRVSAGWPARLSAGTGHDLSRIVEEALTNVRRHSGAAEVAVRLVARPDRLELTIRDDGTGLPWNGTARPGMGLMGMRERAALLGGELDVVGHSGGGTTVRAIVPRAAAERRT